MGSTYSPNDARKQQVAAIEAYMSNVDPKTFRTEISRLLYDYIDYGNAIGTVILKSNIPPTVKENALLLTLDHVYCVLVQWDIVFNPLAENFAKSFKIIREVLSLVDLLTLLKQTLRTKDSEGP